MELKDKSSKGKKRQLFLLNLGKLVLDATKLSFASLVLGTIIKGDLSRSTLLFAGIIASGIGAVAGLYLTTRFEEK